MNREEERASTKDVLQYRIHPFAFCGKKYRKQKKKISHIWGIHAEYM